MKNLAPIVNPKDIVTKEYCDSFHQLITKTVEMSPLSGPVSELRLEITFTQEEIKKIQEGKAVIKITVTSSNGVLPAIFSFDSSSRYDLEGYAHYFTFFGMPEYTIASGLLTFLEGRGDGGTPIGEWETTAVLVVPMNYQTDWQETNSYSSSFIKNKPQNLLTASALKPVETIE